MADLKPIGSEKLTGQDKIKRIMEIARFKETIPNQINETSRSEYSIGLADGNGYEIVKERQGYIIKKVVAEGTTDYIEPMKNRKYYSSYSQAFKRLNLLAAELNRINENEEGVSLYGEQKKIVLKTPKPAADAEVAAAPPAEPPAVPSPELPPSPDAEAPAAEDPGMDDMPADDMPADDMGGEMEMDTEVDIEEPGAEEKVTFKTIQKLTGKLTQKIRTLDNEEGMTSENVKYVINMVLSSLDLGVLSEEDKEDILAKFEEVEGEDEEMGMEEPSPEEDITSDTEVEDMQADMDVPVEGEMGENWGAVARAAAPMVASYIGSKLGETDEEEEEPKEYGHGAIIDSIFGESKIDKVISKYFEISKKEILENREKYSQKKRNAVVSIKRQMGEVKRLVETMEQKLASQKFLEENVGATIVGKTNKKNLVFEIKGKQIKISPEGLLV
jgi:hypothetical protein